MQRPDLIVFDVNETLSDLSPMAQRFTDVGAPGHLAATWFASVLRDGFALTAAGTSGRFADIARDVLHTVLAPVPLNRPVDDAVSHVLSGFTQLDVHPDVSAGVPRMAELGIRLVTMTNGAVSVADGLLRRAGLRAHFERLMSVEDAGVWKPSAGAYSYALAQCDVEPGAAMLVAVHPWDIDGASRAGLRTAWINRQEVRYPSCFETPTVEARSLTELAELVG